MRRWAPLLLLLACKEEHVGPDLSAGVVEVPIATTTTATAATTTRSEAVLETPKSATPAPRKAVATRDAILTKRKQVSERVRTLEAVVAQLEARLKVTGPRNDQRDVLAELGRSRGELVRATALKSRCERAFEGEEWSEIEAAWLLAEDLRSEAERDAAEENYQRFITLVGEFRAHCEVLEPLEGAR